MERKYIFQMDKLTTMNKGFTLLEMMVALVAISTIMITQAAIPSSEFVAYRYLNEITSVQINAIHQVKRLCYENANLQTNYPICFNGKGNSNRAQTILINDTIENNRILIYLGAGKHFIK